MGNSCVGIICIAVAQVLTWSWRFGFAAIADPAAVTAKLRSLLRRFPYWGEGHRLLADAALSERDIATAYAATQCFRIAGDLALNICASQSPKQSKRLESQWRHLLGRCYLASGDAVQALSHLRAARLSCPTSSSIAEDEVAALMALGRNEEAAQVLRTIPEKQLSMSAKIAGDFLRNSISESAGPDSKTR
jgi:hypothetical protein